MKQGSVRSLNKRLRQLGANNYDLVLPEAKALETVLHTQENIIGVVFGHYHKGLPPDRYPGRGALVATDQRVFLLDSKPMFINLDEIIYEVISGITHSHIGGVHNLTLYTRLGNVDIRTFNRVCADQFVEAIESQIFKHGDVQADRF